MFWVAVLTFVPVLTTFCVAPARAAIGLAAVAVLCDVATGFAARALVALRAVTCFVGVAVFVALRADTGVRPPEDVLVLFVVAP